MTAENSNETKVAAIPPANALRVDRWADLPSDRALARYRITDANGDTRELILSKGNRIILDALLKSPVYCASPVRISDRVCILRHEYGVQITKKMYENDAVTDRAKFGVYFIGEGVERIGGEVVLLFRPVSSKNKMNLFS